MEITLVDSIRWAILPGVVVGAMVLFRKLFPAGKSMFKVGNLDSNELYDQFMPVRGRIIGAMILIAILFVFGTWLALTGFNRILAGIDTTASFILLPQTAIWWLFPLFGAVSLCWEITLQIWALFGDRDTVNLFSNWTNHSTAFWGVASYPGMDSRKVLRWMTLLIALPIGVFTLMAVNMHATVGPNTIRDCGYAFKPCEVYPLADVRRMTQIEGFGTKDGKITRRARIVLDFKDGRRWSTADWGNFNDTVDPALADFFIQKTGLPLNSASTEEEIPSLINHQPINPK